MKTQCLMLMIVALITLSANAQNRLGLFTGPQASDAQRAKSDAALASLQNPKALHWGTLSNERKKELWESLQAHLVYFNGELIQAETLHEQASILGSETTITWTENDDGPRKKGLRKITDHVVQVIDDKRVLTEGSDTCLVFASTEKLIEGSKVSTWAKDSGAYSFGSIAGAHRKIQQMSAIELTPPSYAQFLESLKNGERFKVFDTLEIVCPECKGTRLAKQERDVHRASTFCPACHGKGKTTIQGVAELCL